jgi:hypothetical protein
MGAAVSAEEKYSLPADPGLPVEAASPCENLTSSDDRAFSDLPSLCARGSQEMDLTREQRAAFKANMKAAGRADMTSSLESLEWEGNWKKRANPTTILETGEASIEETRETLQEKEVAEASLNDTAHSRPTLPHHQLMVPTVPPVNTQSRSN